MGRIADDQMSRIADEQMSRIAEEQMSTGPCLSAHNINSKCSNLPDGQQISELFSAEFLYQAQKLK